MIVLLPRTRSSRITLRSAPITVAAVAHYRYINRSIKPKTPALYYPRQPYTMASQAQFPPPALAKAAQDLASLLQSRKETISVAETAAGGLISAAILATPGASRVYRGGLTLYTLESRIAFAGWTQEDVKNYGGPTPELVAGLADNVRAKLGSTYTVSESGTAGPTASGKTPNRQPGYVAIAVSGGPQGTVSKSLDTGLGNDRQGNMVAFAVEALTLVKDVITAGNDEAAKI